MELLALYKAILESLSFKATDEGLLTYCYDGEEYPAVIDGKRLTLPTPDNLRSGNWEGRVAFHPLSENPLRGESPVLNKLKQVINHRLSFVISDLMYQLAELGVDSGRHKTLIPKAAEVLSAMPGIDEKFVDTLRKILAKQSNDGPNRLVSIYLKRGGMYKGQKMARVAVVSFPMLEQLQGEPDTVFGVKVRKKDLVILESLFKYILPDADVVETYNAPSRSMSTPYFDALMHAFYNVAHRLNQVIHLQRKQLSNEDELRTRTDWIDSLADLTVYEGQIPSLSGNEGEGAGASEEAAQAATAIRPTPATGAPTAFRAAAPVQAPVPVEAAKAKRDDDTPPWKTDEPAKAKSPFHVENVRNIATGPFHAAAQPTTGFQAAGAKDPNAFDRPNDYHAPKGEKDFASWWAERSKAPAAPVNPNVGYAPVNPYVPQPTAYAPQPAPVFGGQPANVPAWMAAGPAPVPPGEYAGRVRGQLPTQVAYGQPYGYGPQPGYGAAPAPAYGYGQPTPGYGYGGGGRL